MERPSEPPAKQLGSGHTTFELCVSLEKAGDLRKLVGRELEDAATYSPRPRYWFSYELLGVVVQTEQFSSEALDEPGFAVECDWSDAELATIQRRRFCPFNACVSQGLAGQSKLGLDKAAFFRRLDR